MNNLPEPVLVKGEGFVFIFPRSAYYYTLHLESYNYTFFGLIRRSRKLMFKSRDPSETRKVFESLGGVS